MRIAHRVHTYDHPEIAVSCPTCRTTMAVQSHSPCNRVRIVRIWCRSCGLVRIGSTTIRDVAHQLAAQKGE